MRKTADQAFAALVRMVLLTPAGWIGAHVAEGLGLPSMGVYLQPMTPTREFPPSTVTTRSLGGRGNRAAGTALLRLGQQPFQKIVRELRAELDLPPMKPGAHRDVDRRVHARLSFAG